jgi:hypothetical protein
MATLYAITPNGAGKIPGIRIIQEGWPLAVGEVFTVDAVPPWPVMNAQGNGLVSDPTAYQFDTEDEDIRLRMLAIDIRTIRRIRAYLVANVANCPQVIKDFETEFQTLKAQLHGADTSDLT